jgi:hypothetical protein
MARRGPVRRTIAWLALALPFASGLGFAPCAPENHSAVIGYAFASTEYRLEMRAATSPLHPVAFAHAIVRHSSNRPYRWRARALHEPAVEAGRAFRTGRAETSAPSLAVTPHESGFPFALMSGAALEAALARTWS